MLKRVVNMLDCSIHDSAECLMFFHCLNAKELKQMAIIIIELKIGEGQKIIRKRLEIWKIITHHKFKFLKD